MRQEYHNKKAIKDNCIGIIQWWKFKKLFLFFNCEKKVIEELSDVSDIKLLSNKEWDELYKERNVHEGNERERMYGKLHENWLDIQEKMTTNKTGKFSLDFCRFIAHTASKTAIYNEMTEAGLKTIGITGECAYTKDISIKHSFGDESTYSLIFMKAHDEEISNKEIQGIVEEYQKLPDLWQVEKFMNCEESDFLLNG